MSHEAATEPANGAQFSATLPVNNQFVVIAAPQTLYLFAVTPSHSQLGWPAITAGG